jgi:hypothetical protein
MKVITKEYLTDVIFRSINPAIDQHRESKNDIFYQEFPCATSGEILDFIQSIPYFDLRLKDFLAGNMEEEAIIVSQTWEIEFLKKTKLWADSFEWLHGDETYLSEAHINSIKKKEVFLSLPY